MKIAPRRRRPLLGGLIALAMGILRLTCRARGHHDPRPALRQAGTPYIYGVLHAHQVSAALLREPGTVAMVSQSADGQMLIPAFRMLGIRVVRGSSQRSDQQRTSTRGGRAALEALEREVAAGNPAYLALDGPTGPRNHVKKGIAVLARRAHAAVVLVVLRPRRRWILRKSWDRLQIPQPFTCIDGYFAEPLLPQEGETAEQFRRRIEAALNELEQRHDPAEAPAANAAASPTRAVSTSA